MNDNLRSIEEAASKIIGEDVSLQDLEKASNLLKSVADTRKANLEIENDRRTRRLEWIKSILQGLVPVVSLLAVIATVYYNAQQQRLARQQAEDGQWRDFISGMKSQKGDFYADTTLAAGLKSFINSDRFHDQAIDISARILGQISDYEEFLDLYRAVFPNLETADLQSIVSVDKTLKITLDSTLRKCNDISRSTPVPNFSPEFSVAHGGWCSVVVSEEQLNNLAGKLPLNDKNPYNEIVQIRQARISIANAEQFIGEQIALYLKKPLIDQRAIKTDTSVKPIDLEGVYFFSINMSDINLTGVQISNAIFDKCNLSSAILSPSKFFKAQFPGSNWWMAKQIDGELLKYLINTYYPYYSSYEDFGNQVPAPQADRYKLAVMQLCSAAGLSCRPDDLKFGSPATDVSQKNP